MTIRREFFFLTVVLLVAVAPSASQTAQDIPDRVRSLYENGDFAEAARVASESGIHSADIDLYSGLALARLGRLEEARLLLLEGRETYPADARFPVELAGIAYRSHDSRTAETRLREALRLDPSNAYANDFLATLFELDGNLPAALKYWNRIDKPLVQEMRIDPPLELSPVLAERAFAISAGQVFTLDRLEATAANLDRLDLLASYRFDLTPRPDDRFDLTVRSIGKSHLSSAWLSWVIPLLRGLPYQTVDLDVYDIRQRAINFTGLARWDSNKRRIAASLAGPLRENPRLSYRFGVHARDEDWDLRQTYFGRPGGLNSLLLQKIEAGGDIEFGVTPKLQWTSGLSAVRRDFRNGDKSSYFADSWSTELANQLTYQPWIWLEKRITTTASASVGLGRVFAHSPSRYATLAGDVRAVWLPQARGDDLSLSARMRAGKTFGTLPFDEFFMLGMERDNDLWMRGHLGARDGRKGTAPLGTEYALLQTELNWTVLKFPFVRTQVGPFLDVGRIGDPSAQFGSMGWMEDTGMQAKVKSFANIAWTLVYGRNLRDGGGVFYTAVSR